MSTISARDSRFAGMLRGTKLWPFDQAQKLIQWCVPLLKKTLDKMTVETQKHWGSAIATALVRDKTSTVGVCFRKFLKCFLILVAFSFVATSIKAVTCWSCWWRSRLREMLPLKTVGMLLPIFLNVIAPPSEVGNYRRGIEWCIDRLFNFTWNYLVRRQCSLPLFS